jgi:single-strand DNA-binding protein
LCVSSHFALIGTAYRRLIATPREGILAGNLTADPELIANGKGCKFGIAVNERIKRGDEWQDHASFFDVVVWGNAAASCSEHLSKGARVGIDGRLRQERWEKDGSKRSAVKIVAEWVQFLGARQQEPAPATAGAADDDIPF